MKEINEDVFTLIEDHDTIKEAFIVDELQSYMDLKEPSNPKWVTPVRVRLQEKKDWELKVVQAIDKLMEDENYGYSGIDGNELKKVLGIDIK